MSDRSLPRGTPAAPGRIVRTRRAGRYAAAALALVFIAAAAWIASEKLSERARETLEELLSRDTGEPAAIERLVIVSPSHAVLEGVDIGPLAVDELRLDLSPAALLRRDPYRAVKGLSVAGGRLKLGEESAEHGIELHGRISLEPAGSDLRIQAAEGALRVDSREWAVEGEAYVSPQGLSRFKLSLVPKRGASGRIEADGAAVSAPRGFEVRLRGEGVELPFAWALAGPSLFPEQFERIPPPQSGVAGFDVTVWLGANGELKVQGEAAVEGLAWDFVASERAAVRGTYTAAPRPEGAGAGGLEARGGREDAAEVRLELGGGRIFHHAVASLQAEIHGGPAGWRIARAAAEGSGGARYRIDGALPKGQAAHIEVTGEGVPVREVLLWIRTGEGCLDARADGGCRVPWPLLSGAAGTASGSVRAAWETGGLSLAGTIDVGGAWLGSTRLSKGAVEFSRSRGVTELSGRLGLGGGRVTAASIAVREGALSGEIVLDGVALPALEPLLREAGVDLPVDRWRGRVSGRVLLEGESDSPVVRFDLAGERAGFGEIALDRARAAGTWRPGLWEIEAAEGHGPGELQLSARGRIQAGGRVDIELDWTGLAAGLIGTYLGNSLLETVEARVDGALRVWGDGGAPSIAGRAAASAESAGYALDAAVRLDGRIGEIITAEGTVSAGGGAASVRSEWTAGSSRLAVELERFPLAALAGLWGGTGVEGDASGIIDFTWPRGRALRGSARVDVPRLRLGTVVIAQALAKLDLESPAQDLRRAAECGSCLFGEGRITGKIEPEGRSGRPSDVDLVAAFRGDEVELTPVSVSL